MANNIVLAPVPRLALTVQEAADSIGVCKITMQKLIDTAGVPIIKIGRRYLVPVDAFKAWLEAYEGAQIK